jgi:hypothetical protein
MNKISIRFPLYYVTYFFSICNTAFEEPKYANCLLNRLFPFLSFESEKIFSYSSDEVFFAYLLNVTKWAKNTLFWIWPQEWSLVKGEANISTLKSFPFVKPAPPHKKSTFFAENKYLHTR